MNNLVVIFAISDMYLGCSSDSGSDNAHDSAISIDSSSVNIDGTQHIDSDIVVTDAALDCSQDSNSDASINDSGEELTLDARIDDGSTAFATESYIIIKDTTEGIAVGSSSGTDIDSVELDCNGDVTYGVYAEVINGSQIHNLIQAYGPQDGPCDPVSNCAASLGASGVIAVGLSSSQIGCTVIISEMRDFASESGEVYSLPNSTNLDQWESRSIKLGTISDGQSISFVVNLPPD